MNEENVKIQMRKGILEYCILAILSRGDSYAPKIIAELKAAHMIVVEGTLYPILTRQKECRTADIPMGGVAAGGRRENTTCSPKRDGPQLAALDEAWDEMVEQIRIIRHGK